MSELPANFLQDQTASTAVEYGLAVSGIAIVIIATIKLIGTNLSSTFDTLAEALK